MLKIQDIESVIDAMIPAIHNATISFHPQEEAEKSWWVLICGACVDEDCEEERAEARAELEQKVAEAKVELYDFIWIWDKNGTAQLIHSRHSSKKSAEIQAHELSAKGLSVRIMPCFCTT